MKLAETDKTLQQNADKGEEEEVLIKEKKEKQGLQGQGQSLQGQGQSLQGQGKSLQEEKQEKGKIKRLPILTPYLGALPFRSPRDNTWREWLKLVIMTITLIAPLRMLLIILTLGMALLLLMLARRGLSDSDPTPKSGIRHWLLVSAFFCSRLCMTWGGFYYINIKKHPKSQLETARVLVSNHVSTWDGFLLLYLFRPSPVARSDLLNIPVVGGLLRGILTLPVYRITATSNNKLSLKQQLVKRVLDTKSPPILIFPQATTCINQMMNEWMPGAFLAGAPVQLINVNYGANVNYPLDYVQGSMAGIIYRSCCQFINYVEVEILPMYIPSEEEKSNPNLYCENVKKYMVQHKKCVVTPHAYIDHLLAAWADDHPQYSVDNILSSYVTKETGMHSSALLLVCESFPGLDKDRDGVISRHEYNQLLSLDDANTIFKTVADKLFDFADANGRGYWTMQNFIVLIGTMTSFQNKWYPISLLFNVCDLNDDQIITKQSVEQLIAYLKDVRSKQKKAESEAQQEDGETTKEKINFTPELDMQKLSTVLFSSNKKQLTFEEFSNALREDDFKSIQNLFIWFMRYGLGMDEKTISKLVEYQQSYSSKPKIY